MKVKQSLEVLHGFIDESNESLQNIESTFIALEKDPGNHEIIDKIFRPVHSLKGNSGFFGLTNINKFSHRMENLLDFIRKDEIPVTEKIIDILLTGIDYLQKMLDRAYADPGDTALRPEEEAFLTDQVDTCTPTRPGGNLQSVFDLLDLLEEAIELGMDIRKISLVNKILDHIETSYTGIKDLVERNKSQSGKTVYHPEADYFYKDRNCTDLIKPFGKVLEELKEHQPIKKTLLDGFLDALDRCEHILKEEEKLPEVFDKLRSMANFFDDELLISTPEFYSSVLPLINDIISVFSCDTDNTGDVKRMGEILVDQKKINDDQLMQALAKQNKLGEILVTDGVVNAEDVKDALGEQAKQMLKTGAKKKAAHEKTIRIDQYKLDEFANSVGELFINLDAFSFLKSRMEHAKTDFEILSKFANTVSSMDDRVSKLQENIMDIRKVPVKNLFQRFPRIIRELAISLEKKIDFRVIGEDTVIDKDLLEKLENPLVHILRNSVDHGIEHPKQREEKGKDPVGRISLEARVDEYSVHLMITDDGQGIHPEKVKKAAFEKGLLNEIELAGLSDNEAVNLIFRPGFSTAEKVSDVSGRGVGMDVVMSSIKESNGNVVMDSEPGKGSNIKIKIPLTKTLVTKDALIVESAGQLFAIPSDEITTTLYVDDINMGSILAQDKVISYNGAVHKVESINQFYYQEDTQEGHSDPVLVVCSRHNVALLVDRMLNHQKIVVKNFQKSLKQFNHIPGINGYTLLGNEDIVLIIDVDEMIKSLSVSTDKKSKVRPVRKIKKPSSGEQPAVFV